MSGAIDPLAQVVGLLRPTAPFSKSGSGAGRWRIHRSDVGRPFYCLVLEGRCRLAAAGHEEIALQPGDFVLIPSAQDFTMSSHLPAGPGDTVQAPVMLPGGEHRLGDPDAPAEVRLLIGYCEFAAVDATLLASLLPTLVHVRDQHRLATLVQLIGEESRAARPAREVVLERLLEVLLIEALRCGTAGGASPGLLRGLGDRRIAPALRRMHERPDLAWTVAGLAQAAQLSRSAFYERFGRTVGIAPMEYLLAWRMALACDLLRRKEAGIAAIAQRVGYSSASTFTVAFSRHVGVSPARYGRRVAGEAGASPPAGPDRAASPAHR